MKTLHSLLVLILSATLLHAETQPFLDQTKEVVSQVEWNREIVSKSGGKFKFTIDSEGPISVILVSGNGYKAILSKNAEALQKSDILLNVPSAPSPYEGMVTVPAGSSWFIIQNLADKSVKMRLRCTSTGR